MSLPAVSGKSSDGKMLFNYVPTHLVRQAWPTIVAGVSKVRESNNESWLAEDIYAALVSNKASLYLINDENGGFAGFGILEVMAFPFEVNPCLNIWIGYFSEKGNGHYGIEYAKLVAGHAGLDRVVFSSPQENSWTKNFRRITSWYEV